MAILPHNYRSSYEYLIHCQRKDSHAHYVLIYVPMQSCHLLSLEWLSYFEHIIHILQSLS